MSIASQWKRIYSNSVVNSVSTIEPVADFTITETDTYGPDIKTRKTMWESCISLETKAEAVRVRKEGRFPGLDGTVIRRQMPRAIKYEDHG